MTSVLNLNPRTPLHEKKSIHVAVAQQNLQDGVWLRSSGTESGTKGIKLVFLSHSAMQAAAEAANSFLNLQAEDVWLNPLPKFHVGGLMAETRCSFAGAKEVEMTAWDAHSFVNRIHESGATITSLVPTQVYDLVKFNMECPPALRAILVGGGALDAQLYNKARQLGWPLLPSYGMTETAAMVACATLSSLETTRFPQMQLLDHIQLQESENKWEINSQSLFSGYLWVREKGWEWQARPTPFVLDDNLKFDGTFLKVYGRSSDLVKILGETVNLSVLEQKLLSKIDRPLSVVAKPAERRGFSLHLFIEGSTENISVDVINGDLMPFERLSGLHGIEQLPRTELGKVLKNQLLAMI